MKKYNNLIVFFYTRKVVMINQHKPSFTPCWSRILSTTCLSIIHSWSTVSWAIARLRVSAFSACNMPAHSPHIQLMTESGGAPPIHLRCHDLGHALHSASTDSLWQRQQKRSLLVSGRFRLFAVLTLPPPFCCCSTGEVRTGGVLRCGIANINDLVMITIFMIFVSQLCLSTLY